MHNGLIKIPDRPGIGVEPDDEALAEATVEREQFRVTPRILAGWQG